MVKLALTVAAIALPDCINPSLIGGELFVAMGSRPRRRTAAFTLAALAVTFVFGLAFARKAGACYAATGCGAAIRAGLLMVGESRQRCADPPTPGFLVTFKNRARR